MSARLTLADLANRPTLSVTEAAGLLHVSTDLLYQSVQRGEIPCLRLGRKLLIPTQRLLDLIGGVA